MYIFPVNKQGSIESPPRKQRLESDTRKKQTIVAKNQLVIMQAVIGAHCKNFTGSNKNADHSKFPQMWVRQSHVVRPSFPMMTITSSMMMMSCLVDHVGGGG